MKPRYLQSPIADICFENHKITMISGPRQCGKTTLAKELLRQRGYGRYHNWDDKVLREAWRKDPKGVLVPGTAHTAPLIVLDEIHKDRKWKRTLKGIYDTLETPVDFIVTGSGRLNIYHRGSDSLMGRMYHFRLHPFSLRELQDPSLPTPDEVLRRLFEIREEPHPRPQRDLKDLLEYGPFPEPLFRQDKVKARIWRNNRNSQVVREDLRDTSALIDLGKVEMLLDYLPDRVGSVLRPSSVATALEVGFASAKRWLNYLSELYHVFEVKPFTGRIPRSLRKDGKIYLWDYGAVPNEAARFENMVGSHLLKACHAWTDTGHGKFELFYLSTKEGREIDFLIVKDGTPWLPVEVKQSETRVSPQFQIFFKHLPCSRGLQVVFKPHWKFHECGRADVLVAGAAEVLAQFI